MTRSTGFVAVFVKYPPTSHRAQVAPGFTPWGNEAIALADSECDDKIERVTWLAKRHGCQVRIQAVDPSDLQD